MTTGCVRYRGKDVVSAPGALVVKGQAAQIQGVITAVQDNGGVAVAGSSLDMINGRYIKMKYSALDTR